MCLQRNNLLCPVHDSTICFDRSTDDIVVVLEVNDNDFRGRGLVLLFSNTHERVGFECLPSAISQASKEVQWLLGKLTHELNPIDDC